MFAYMEKELTSNHIWKEKRLIFHPTPIDIQIHRKLFHSIGSIDGKLST